MAKGHGFAKLLCHPGIGRMRGAPEGNDPPRAGLEDEEGVDLPKDQVDDWKEVAGPHTGWA